MKIMKACLRAGFVMFMLCAENCLGSCDVGDFIENAFCICRGPGGMYDTDSPSALESYQLCDMYCSALVSPVCGNADTAPTAVNVNISGAAVVGQKLTGNYTYSDSDTPPDEEGTSTFKWFASDGPAKIEITGAAEKTYTVQSGDEGKYICFEVTPVDNTGTKGTAASACTDSAVVPAGPGYKSESEPGSALDAGIANVGDSVSKTLSVSESGSAELQVTGNELFGANAADFSVTPATLSIADGGPAQDLTIKCSPSAAGIRTATLTVSYNAAGSPATYTLTCTGKLPGDADGNGKIELADAILALKIATGFTVSPVNLNADVNGDGKIGTAEAVYILAHLF